METLRTQVGAYNTLPTQRKNKELTKSKKNSVVWSEFYNDYIEMKYALYSTFYNDWFYEDDLFYDDDTQNYYLRKDL